MSGTKLECISTHMHYMVHYLLSPWLYGHTDVPICFSLTYTCLHLLYWTVFVHFQPVLWPWLYGHTDYQFVSLLHISICKRELFICYIGQLLYTSNLYCGLGCMAILTTTLISLTYTCLHLLYWSVIVHFQPVFRLPFAPSW